MDRLAFVAAPAVVLPPLIWLATAALGALREGGSGWGSPGAAVLLQRSAAIAGLTTLVALALGAPYGWLTARYRWPGARPAAAAGLLPLFLPPYAGALAWSILLEREGPLNRLLLERGWIAAPLSPYRSVAVTVVVLASVYWPVIAAFTWLAARSVPRELEEAARLALPDGAAARWAARPALARALSAAALLVFLLALADFGVASSLGLPTYPVEVVSRFELDRNPGVVARLSLPLLALVTPLVALQLRFLAGVSAGRRSEEGEPPPLRSPLGPLAALWCLAVLLGTLVLPLGTLLVESLPPATYPAVWAETADHFGNTLVTAGACGALAAGLALLHGWGGRGRTPAPLDLALTLPYALPASLPAVAMIRLLNRPGPTEWLYTSPAGLIWLDVVLFYAFAHKSLQPAWGNVDPELVDEALLAGASGWQQFRAAVWPVARPYVWLGGGLAAVLAAREVEGTALLRIPGWDTVAFRILDYLHFAPGPKPAALCVLLVLLSGGVGAAAWRMAAPRDLPPGGRRGVRARGVRTPPLRRK